MSGGLVRAVWVVLAACVVIPLVGLFLLVMNPVWRDDARLEAFYERVVAYPLPPSSRDAFPMDRDVTFGKNLAEAVAPIATTAFASHSRRRSRRRKSAATTTAPRLPEPSTRR